MWWNHPKMRPVMAWRDGHPDRWRWRIEPIYKWKRILIGARLFEEIGVWNEAIILVVYRHRFTVRFK